MDSYSNTNMVLTMSVEPYSANVTDKQQKLYLALVLAGCEVSGYTYSEFEEELINSFAPYKYTTSILGGNVKQRKKVSEMNHKEFNIFIEQSIAFATEFYGLKF